MAGESTRPRTECSPAVQSLSVIQLYHSMDCSAPDTSTLHCLKLMSSELVTSSKHLILCYRLLLLILIFPSIGVYSNELPLLVRWPKYWRFSFSISPSNEYSVLISFRIDWFDSLAVQGTLKSLLWDHSLKTSILQHSAFFMVQISYPYMTTGKTIALTIWYLCFLICCLGLS